MGKGFVSFRIGLLLILLSAPLLYAMGREILVQQKVNYQYQIENIYHPIDMTTDPFQQLMYLEDGTMKPFPEMKRKVYVNDKLISDYSEFAYMLHPSGDNKLKRVITFYEIDIEIIDTFTSPSNQEEKVKSDVDILIEGMNYAEAVPVEIRPSYLDNNRYHGYIGMLKLTKKSTNEEFLIVVQRLFDDTHLIEEDFKWKVISIRNDGEVQTDIFSREQIKELPYRKDLINKATISPYSLGYQSNILHGYPSLFFPLLYPFCTIVSGLLMLEIGIVRRRKSK